MPGRRAREESEWTAASNELSKTLREARAGRGLTQEDLATQSGVRLSSVRAIEDGRVVEPGVFKVVLLARTLDLDLDDLLRRVRPRSLD